MSRKPTGVAAFSLVPSTPPPARKKRAARGAGAVVHLTIRVSRSHWLRLRQCTDAEAIDMQDLLREGLDLALIRRGLPPLAHED